jgi:hypothetical protein
MQFHFYTWLLRFFKEVTETFSIGRLVSSPYEIVRLEIHPVSPTVIFEVCVIDNTNMVQVRTLECR